MASILLQSSFAVAMLLAGFMSAGAISGAAGLAIMLGADLGSAIVVQILTSPISVFTPLLLLVGVATNLEPGADVIAWKMVSLARQKNVEKTCFPD